MDTLADFKRQGKVRWYGISTNHTQVIRQLQALGELSVVQVGYNMINRGGESTLALAKAENLGTLIRMPLASGALAGKYFHDGPELNGGDVRKSRFESEPGIAALKSLSEL